MELRVLRYFLAVAREGNITAAANFLHLTRMANCLTLSNFIFMVWKFEILTTTVNINGLT